MVALAPDFHLTCSDPWTLGGMCGTFIDTADIYSNWAAGHVGRESERIIGRWLAARGSRPDGLVIATKVGLKMPEGSGLGREHVLRSAERSLEQLGVDAIDLYLSHADDAATPLEETMRTFDELVQRGLVRVLGASNISGARLTEALRVSEQHGLARYEVLQPKYNLLDRAEFEQDLRPVCEREGISVTPYYPLAAGFLTGKYVQGQPAPDTERAAGCLAEYGNGRGWRVVDEVRNVAREVGVTPAQVAIAWIAAQPAITAPIVGANSVAQLEQVLAGAQLKLDDAQLARLHAASDEKMPANQT